MNKNLKYFFGALVLSFFIFGGINVFQNNLSSHLAAEIAGPAASTFSSVTNEGPTAPAPEINASSAISLRIAPNGTQKTLLQKNIEEPLPIASLTKLMAALIVFEDPSNFDFSKVITISKKAANQDDPPIYGNLTAGENYTLGKLVEMMLVYSSNDSAFAISEIIGTDNFVAKMNKKALDLGMDYTYFVNPTGLDPINLQNPKTNEMNYSTAGDMAKLAEYILKNYPQIFELTLQGYGLPIENGISSLKLTEGQTAVGGKTGFTKNAKGSLLFIFRDVKQNTFINIILGTETNELRIQEMQKIINWLSL